MGPSRSAGYALETHPSQYRHWRLTVDPPLATLTLAVDEESPAVPGYKLKLNSYDLGVDIELADAVTRLRFEHPEVRAVVITGGLDRVFCAGANIHMLATSAHAFKVNFCKYTNETRLAIEDACAHSGQHYIAACNGTTAGGGYELALACEEIYLVDDGNSAVSLPEVPLLGVLPGTGGLTRVIDKRKVRRDLADVFATLAEGVKGKRAVEWRLVDGLFPKSRFQEAVRARALALAARETQPRGPGIVLEPLGPQVTPDAVRYRHVRLCLHRDQRTAELTIEAGSDYDPLRAFRELDDALLRLRLYYDEIGLVILKTRGDLQAVLQSDASLFSQRADWLAHETLLLMARTLRRLDLTARTLFAVADEGSCFAGSLLEIALAADRIYMLRDSGGAVRMAASPLNGGLLPMTHGLSRLQVRFLADPPQAEKIAAASEPFATEAAEQAGLVTAAVDEIDWEDELRVAIEERASLSPDALTGMEANLRFAGAENPDSKIFGRLSAWQNWIFSRPNATGERGALTLYGKPERPQFNWRRT
ncbi:MAG TPA: 2,3-epoxybenzoyl-CoA dihydrolase [Bryobacteraceae bacterium]|nr:2,3-epoxybenzoyl-CoA dihydrolase [Bryobacteraceae bacterium]